MLSFEVLGKRNHSYMQQELKSRQLFIKIIVFGLKGLNIPLHPVQMHQIKNQFFNFDFVFSAAARPRVPFRVPTELFSNARAHAPADALVRG